MRRFLLPSILLVTVALAAQDSQPDTQVGNFLFKMPTGWSPSQMGDITYIYAPAPAPGTVTYIGLAADNIDTNLEKSFNELWSGFTKAYRIVQGGQMVPLHSRNGYDAYYTRALAADQNGTQWHVVLMAAQYKNRVETVMFMSNIPSLETYSAYEKVFQTFQASLRFGEALPRAPAVPDSAAGAAPVVPATTDAQDKPHKLPPGALEGIYVGFYIGSAGRVSLRSLIFNPDGWVLKNIPDEGMIGFDFTALRNDPNTNKSWIGRYRVAGNEINIVWQDYVEDRESIRRNEASGSPGLNTYVPMCRCTGKKFSGKYNWGLASSGQYLQFFPDGTFIDHQVTDQMIVPSAFYDRPRIQRGRYSIQNQTLVFNFADGRRAMRTFYAPKAQESAGIFDWISLGGHTLYEEHHQNEP